MPDRNLLKHTSATPQLRERVVAKAMLELGVREQGCQNCGARVKQYLAYTGINIPAPWCAVFVSFVFKEAGLKAPRTAWSPALFPKSKLQNSPAPGLVLGIYYQELGRIGHCGIVKSVRGDLVYSIEGNTNGAGNREGDGVYVKIRAKRTIARYADWTEGGTP